MGKYVDFGKTWKWKQMFHRGWNSITFVGSKEKKFCHLKIYQRRKENKGLEIAFSILSGKI